MINAITALQAWVVARMQKEDGATMVEYGLMVALIAIVCIGAITAIGTGLNGLFTTVAGSL